MKKYEDWHSPSARQMFHLLTLLWTHTHALDTIRLFLDPQTLPLIKILICRTIKSQWTDTWCTASAYLFRHEDKNGQWQNYRCHFPYNDHWRVSHHARSCASYEITLPPFTADFLCILRDPFLSVASSWPNMCSLALQTSSDLHVPQTCPTTFWQCLVMLLPMCAPPSFKCVLSVPTCCPTNDRLIQIWEHFMYT